MGTTLSAVQNAARVGHLHQLAHLLNSRADIEAIGESPDTALILAAKHNHTPCVELLLHSKANVEATGKDGKTALIWSIEEYNVDCAQMLLSAKAQVNYYTQQYCFTPLQIAANNGYIDALRLLLAANAHVDGPDSRKCTALMHAASNNRRKCLRMLMEAKANIDAMDQYGRTAVHWAAFNGSTMSLAMLMDAKACTEYRDSSGKSPLMLAAERGHAQCMQILKQHRGQAGVRVESTFEHSVSESIRVMTAVEQTNIPAGTITVTTTVEQQQPLSVLPPVHAESRPTEDIPSHQLPSMPSEFLQALSPIQPQHTQSEPAHTLSPAPLQHMQPGPAQSVSPLQPQYPHAVLTQPISHMQPQRAPWAFTPACAPAQPQWTQSGDMPVRTHPGEWPSATAPACIVYERDGRAAFIDAQMRGGSIIAQPPVDQLPTEPQSSCPDHALGNIWAREHDQLTFNKMTSRTPFDPENGFAPIVYAVENNASHYPEPLTVSGLSPATSGEEHSSVANRTSGTDILSMTTEFASQTQNSTHFPPHNHPQGLSQSPASHIKVPPRPNLPQNNNAACLAAQDGDEHMLKQLIASKASIYTKNRYGNTPLLLAAYRRHPRCVSILIEAGAPLDARDPAGRTALSLAALHNDVNMLQLLLAAKASCSILDNSGCSPLTLAMQCGCEEAAQVLLQAPDVNGNTVIAAAAGNGNTEAVKMLIAAKALVNVQNNAMETPLMLAVQKGHMAIAQLLVDARGDVNVAKGDGVTMLMTAASNNHAAMIHQLIEFKANVNIQDNDAKTALHYAVVSNCLDSMRVLLDAGADIDVQCH